MSKKGDGKSQGMLRWRGAGQNGKRGEGAKWDTEKVKDFQG